MFVNFFAYLLAIQSVFAVEYTDLVDISKPNIPLSLNETDFADIDDIDDIDVRSIIIKELEKDGMPIDVATMEMINNPITYGDKLLDNLTMDGDLEFNNESNEVGFNGVLGGHKNRKHWPSGIVPYMVSSQYGQKGRKLIAAAAAQFEKYTCVKLVPRSNEPDYVYIQPLQGCYSRVGRNYNGGVQPLSLAPLCLHKSTIVHEMMHAIGFFHEQTRSDRDNYVTVLFHNIQKSQYGQYNKVDSTDASLLGLPYDQESIMHYADTAFRTRDAAMAGRKTMTSKTGKKQFSNELGLTELDIKKINKLYGCPNRPIPRPVPADVTTTTPTARPMVSNCRYDTVAGSKRAVSSGLLSMYTSTADKCCQACRDKSQCKAFTWTRSNSMCWMHRAGFENNIRNDCGTDCWFAVMRNQPTAVTNPTIPAKERCTYDCAACGKRGTASGLASMKTNTPDDCCRECRKRHQCKAFTWTLKLSMCWMHTVAYKNNIINDCGTDCWFSQM